MTTRPAEPTPIPRWPRSVLVGLERDHLRRPRRLKTEVSRIGMDGRDLVLKEVTRMPWLLRVTLGRALLAREARTYARLAGIDGIPRLVARVGRDAIIMEYMEGLPLRRETCPDLPPDFFDRLTRLVDRIHERRILHLDLGQRKNIMVRPDGSPVIIDFGSALGAGLSAPLFPLLHRLLGWIDQRGVLMQRLRYGDGILDEESRRRLRRLNRIRALWFFNRPANPRHF